MAQTDPTFYRSPGEAIAAPPERLAYVAAYDPAGRDWDAIAVIDCDRPRPTTARWSGGASCPPPAMSSTTSSGTPVPAPCATMATATTGRWNAATCWCPACAPRAPTSWTPSPTPATPRVVREISAEELANKAGYSRPHTLHCGPGAIFMSALGGANGHDGPGGVALLDHDTFDILGAWEQDRGEQFFAYDVWWHLNHDTVITSKWGTPSMFENGLDPMTCSAADSATT